MINAVIDTAFKVVSGFNGVRRSVQCQFDELFDETSVIHTELNTCIKSGSNTLSEDVTLTSPFKLCGATASEIAHLSGLTTDIQTLCDDAIKRHGNS